MFEVEVLEVVFIWQRHPRKHCGVWPKYFFFFGGSLSQTYSVLKLIPLVGFGKETTEH